MSFTSPGDVVPKLSPTNFALAASRASSKGRVRAQPLGSWSGRSHGGRMPPGRKGRLFALDQPA